MERSRGARRGRPRAARRSAPHEAEALGRPARARLHLEHAGDLPRLLRSAAGAAPGSPAGQRAGGEAPQAPAGLRRQLRLPQRAAPRASARAQASLAPAPPRAGRGSTRRGASACAHLLVLRLAAGAEALARRLGGRCERHHVLHRGAHAASTGATLPTAHAGLQHPICRRAPGYGCRILPALGRALDARQRGRSYTAACARLRRRRGLPPLLKGGRALANSGAPRRRRACAWRCRCCWPLPRPSRCARAGPPARAAAGRP